jgi:dTDP-4-amino-4,6-dideoxygalactose transaminase
MIKIPFNKPFLTGKEQDYIYEAISSGKISGDGIFTKKCSLLFEQRFQIKKTLLTTSCTDALEMAAILLDIKPGDEIIAPSFTFVSTVNPFILRGAKVIFADSNSFNPNIDADKIEPLISSRTRAIIPVHYAGIACDMDKIVSIAKDNNISIVEDCAQAIDSFYKKKTLGTFGELATFSFHETKNIISGEGGLLAINDSKYIKRAEIIWEKGTNRSSFFRGEVDKYGWVDIGSSFLPSEITAAFLFAQLENIERIQNKRKLIWNTYYTLLLSLEQEGLLKLPFIPNFASNNAHMFYIILNDISQRSSLIAHLRNKGILSVFHYLSLHKSKFYEGKYSGEELVNADKYSDCLLRLPMFYELEVSQVEMICEEIVLFFRKKL